MIINHNIAALNTHRQMGSAQSAQMDSMEKLSSGLRINSAKDDAAGLTISEKMRGQIRGLEQASTNAQDGISLIQTAEGSLSVTQDILQRMRELSVQASNDTMTDDDRVEIQKEVGQLKEEIDRISNDTEFNTKKLLNGDLETAKTAQGTKLASVALQTGGSAVTNATTTTLQSLQDANGNSLGLKGGDVVEITGIKNGSPINTSYTIAGNKTTSDVSLEGVNDGDAAFTLSANETFDFEYDGQVYTAKIASTVTSGTGQLGNQISALETALQTATGNTDIGITRNTAAGGGGDDTITISSASGKDVKIIGSSNNNFNAALTGANANTTATAGVGGHLDELLTKIDSMTGGTSSINSAGKLEILGANGSANGLSNVKLSVEGRELFNNKMSAFKETQAAQDHNINSSISFQIGANEGQSISVDINEMSVKSLSLSSVDVSTQQGAQTSMTVITDALAKVSTERSKLGSTQNRLEHTINNLNTSAENLTSAESRIRDVDYTEAA